MVTKAAMPPKKMEAKVAAFETKVEGLKSILQVSQIKVEDNQERLIIIISKNKEESNGKVLGIQN